MQIHNENYFLAPGLLNLTRLTMSLLLLFLDMSSLLQTWDLMSPSLLSPFHWPETDDPEREDNDARYYLENVTKQKQIQTFGCRAKPGDGVSKAQLHAGQNTTSHAAPESICSKHWTSTFFTARDKRGMITVMIISGVGDPASQQSK